MQSWWDRHPDETRPDPPADAAWPARLRFIPQRTRAVRKAKRLAVVGGLFALAGLVLLIRWLF
jgi:hypothetical protein